ncbi:MAG: ABC transporter ATP-binding protein, partial [Desulfobulbaceae bacterium]|nr:ABC transporter ATP-binding protein [Desulfobulbaceae bacterium]
MSFFNLTGENIDKKEPSPVAKLSDLLTILLPIFRLNRGRLLVGFAALLGVDFLQLIIPRFLKSGVDSLSTSSATSASLLTISCYILLTAAGVGLLRFVWRYMIIGFSRFLERHLRNRIFGHILLMDRPFFEKWTTGNIMAHAGNDLSAVQMACGMGMVAAVDALVMSSAAICFMLFINVKLTLIALLPMPFLAVCTLILSGRLHHRFNLVQEQFSLLTEFARTTLVSIKLIKGYTLERLQEREFERLGKQYVRSNLRVATIQGLLFPIATMVGNTGMLFVLYFGGRLVVDGAISLGDFVAFIIYLYMLVWPIMAVGWVANLAQRGITSLRRVHKLLQDRPYLKDVEQESLQPIEQAVFRLQGLTFAYPAARDPALCDIDLRIGPGILGVAGRTGSGKSTLCKLLVRLYPVDDGVLFF